jgi:hypothetical protein
MSRLEHCWQPSELINVFYQEPERIEFHCTQVRIFRHYCCLVFERFLFEVQVGNGLSDWLRNCCWSSPAHWFLVSSPIRLMTIFHSLTAPGTFRLYLSCPDGLSDLLLNCCWPSSAQWFMVPSPTGLMTIFYSLKGLGAFRSYLSVQTV